MMRSPMQTLLFVLAACGGSSTDVPADGPPASPDTASDTASDSVPGEPTPDPSVDSADTAKGSALDTALDSASGTSDTVSIGATADTGPTTATTDTSDSGTGIGKGCAYPEGAVEPMAEGEVLTPYSWPAAEHLDGTQASLELGKVPCGTDDDIDWSPFDILMFVSIPAW